MSAEEVIRAAILKQIRQWTNRELESHLRNSTDIAAFVRVREGKRSFDSTLQANTNAIRPKTRECINRDVLLRIASKEGIEKGRQVCVDSKAAPTNIHYPRESVFVEDCVRFLSRIRELYFQQECTCRRLNFLAKGLANFTWACSIQKTITTASLSESLVIGVGDDLDQITEYLRLTSPEVNPDNKYILRLQELQSLMSGIIAQTITRVIDGKQYPSTDKVDSFLPIRQLSLYNRDATPLINYS